MKPKILLIIPAFNEEKSIEKTIASISMLGYDYIIINDGSTDRTKDILTANHYNHINLLSNLGIGGAVQTGYKYARDNGYDIAIQFDADGQHDAKYLPDLIAPIVSKQANLVIGSCFVNKNSKVKRSSAIRRIGIRFLSNVVYAFSGKRIHDITSGFRAADKKTISYFADNYPTEYPEPVSNYDLSRSTEFKILEVPVKMNRRENGKSSIRSWKSVYAAINVFLSIIILSLRRKHE